MTSLSAAGPRVVLAPGRYGALDARAAAEALHQGWSQRAGHVTLHDLPQGDGGPGLLGALAGRGEPFVVSVPDGDGVPRAVPLLRTGDPASVVVESAAVERACGAADSAPLGRLLAALSERGFTRISIGLGGNRVLDGGRALIGALARDDEGRPDPVAARRRLEGTHLTGVVDSDRVLLGLQGACANAVDDLGWTREQAQHAERAMGEWVDDVRRAVPEQVELLSGRPRRVDRLPGAGAGGGLGFALGVLGARLVSGPRWVAERTGLSDALAGAFLIVTTTSIYDWRQLEHSVVRQVADAASAAAVPGVVLAQEVHVGRRETMSLGLSGSYAPTAVGRRHRAGPGSSDADADELRKLAARVAGTWTPNRSAT